MATTHNKFENTWADMGIDFSDWQTNPAEFCKRVAKKANELAAELQKENSLMDTEERFKARAYSNKEAAAEAQEFIDLLMEKMSNSSPEVIANIMVRMPEVTSYGHTIIRTTSMRLGRSMSKKRTHAMYVKLRKMYESYTNFYKMVYPDQLKNPPIIPARSGNYGDEGKNLGIKEYIFCIGEEEYMNYYTAARILGIEIANYMDLVEYYQANKTSTDGRKLTLIDLSH